jgi:hypothetical protein
MYYEIKEPGSYEPNTFAGRWLKVTLSGGSSSSSGGSMSSSSAGGSGLILITGNDDNTLYFAPQSGVVAAGAGYEIIEFGTGTTWKYSTTKPTDGRNYVPVTVTTGGGSSSSSTMTAYWVQPVGEDNRTMMDLSSSSAGPWVFKADQTANEPTIVKRYGIVEKGDFFAPETFNELYHVINQLGDTTTGVTWTSRADPCTPENNLCPGVNGGGVTEPTFTGYVFDSGSAYAGFGACTGKTIFTTWEDSLAAAQSDILAYLASPVPFFGWPSADCPPSNACGDCQCGTTPYEDNGVAPYKNAVATVVQLQNPNDLSGDTFGNLGEGGGADVESAYAYAQVSNVTTVFGSTIDFYNYADTYSGSPTHGWCWSADTYSYPDCVDGFNYVSSGTSIEFKNSGDMVNYHQWTQWDTESVNAYGYAISTKLGSQTTGTLPTIEADPSAPGSCYTWTAFAEAGYNVTNAIAVIHWTFTYVA